MTKKQFFLRNCAPFFIFGMMPNMPISTVIIVLAMMPVFVWFMYAGVSMFVHREFLVLFPAFFGCFIAGVVAGVMIRLLTVGLNSLI